MLTFTERFLHTIPAARTVLRGIGWWHGDCDTTGTCCLVEGDPSKLPPGHIRNGLGQAMMLHHVGNLQIFKGQHPVGVHHPASGLVTEVVAPIRNALMDVRHHRATFGTDWCAFVNLGQPPLGFG